MLMYRMRWQERFRVQQMSRLNARCFAFGHEPENDLYNQLTWLGKPAIIDTHIALPSPPARWAGLA